MSTLTEDDLDKALFDTTVNILAIIKRERDGSNTSDADLMKDIVTQLQTVAEKFGQYGSLIGADIAMTEVEKRIEAKLPRRAEQ